MGKVSENLDKLLDLDHSSVIEPENFSNITQEVTVLPGLAIVPETPELVLKSIDESEPKEVTEDYELSRETYRNLVQKGDSALHDLLAVAKESESPRAYEVVATLIKTLSDTTKELLDVHKKRKEIKKVDHPDARQPRNEQISVEKAVFIGRPSDLLSQIKRDSG